MKDIKATSTDVARLAGVSQSTVSMVLNGDENISFKQDTVDRVTAAAKELNYHIKKPKRHSKALEKTIMVFIPSFSNDYYSTLIQAIEVTALKYGYSILLCNTNRDYELEKMHVKTLLKLPVSGVIYAYFPAFLDLAQQVLDKFPTVLIGDKDESINVDAVELNSYKSGLIMADHLIRLGHKHIAYITTPILESTIARKRRFEGFKAKIVENNLEDYLILRQAEERGILAAQEFGPEFQVGYDMATDILTQRLNVTAFAGLNDMVALGIMDAIISKGYKIPQDYSVIGCDNNHSSGFPGIGLTSIEHFVRAKGEEAAELIVKKINSVENTSELSLPSSITRVEYEPKLLIRLSTAALRNRKTNNTRDN